MFIIMIDLYGYPKYVLINMLKLQCIMYSKISKRLSIVKKQFILMFAILTMFIYAKDKDSCYILKESLTDLSQLSDTKTVIQKCSQAIKKISKRNPTKSLYSYIIGQAFDRTEEKKNAFKWYKQAAQLGNAEAQAEIGFIYSNMWSAQRYAVKENAKLAFKWYKKAANQGNKSALNGLADMYYYGIGVKKNYKKAISLYKQLALSGNLTRAFQLGEIYYKGEITNKNYKEAFRWFLIAANQNYNISSQLYIAKMYYSGKGVTQNYNKAFFWFSKLANKNEVEAQHMLGSMFYLGEGVDENKTKALEFYNKACINYNIESCITLGYILTTPPKMNLSNKDKKQNLLRGTDLYINYYYNNNTHDIIKYIRKVIEYGYGNAYLYGQLGLIYFKGQGVPKNYIKSYAWYSHALALDESSTFYTEQLKALENKMTPKQIIFAQNYDPITEIQNKKTITHDKEQYNINTGTGFFVNNDIVITNHHVTKDCKKIELIRQGYKSSANILAIDTKNDLALIKAKVLNKKYLQFRAGKGIRIGDGVIVIGYPLGKLLGDGIKLTTGNISALTGLLNDTSTMQLTAPVQPGNSGGALLDNSGRVVGIIVARLKNQQNVNLAIKATMAQMFLDINNIDYTVSLYEEKKNVADIADEARDSIIQVVCYQ